MENNLLFKDLDLSKEMQKSITNMGFEEATPIQSLALNPILEGKDVIGQAQTGTGKTCAFGIPAIEKLDMSLAGVQVLILCPTRELAIQVSEELQNLAKYKRGVNILPIYGGQSIDRQIMMLKKKPQIIVGTPGRVMDHMKRRTLKFQDLNMMILDEADEMLNMGFREDIDAILQEIHEDRQTLLFSATMPRGIMDLTKKYQKDPVHVKAAHKQVTVPSIEQYYIEVRESGKMELLCRLIDAKNIKLGIVFCNTKRKVDELTSGLQNRGYAAEALHGDMKQTERDRVMNKFRKGVIDILVATDVAARGIDVSDIEAVFNFDIPNDEEYYVHRIGRTGRAGKSGVAYSFVFGREIYKLKDIQRYTKSQIIAAKPPSIADIQETRLAASINKIKEVLQEGKYKKHIINVDAIMDTIDEPEELTSIDLAAALFHLAFDEGENKAYENDFEESTYSTKNMTRLFLNVGAMDKIQPGTIVQWVASHSAMPGKLIGAIDIHKNFTFVEVPAEYAEEIMDSMKNFVHKGRKVAIEKSQKRQPYRNKGRGNSRSKS